MSEGEAEHKATAPLSEREAAAWIARREAALHRALEELQDGSAAWSDAKTRALYCGNYALGLLIDPGVRKALQRAQRRARECASVGNGGGGH